MRFKLFLECATAHRMLPIDYQYFISAWVYKVIGNADPTFASFLHNEGYTDGAKRFKLFCFSPLNFQIERVARGQSFLTMKGHEASLLVSFYLPEAAERFIHGLFQHQTMYIGDRQNGIDFSVSQIERQPAPAIFPSMHYEARSPVVISTRDDGSKYARYLSPQDNGYAALLKNNLLQRWATIPGAEPLPNEFDFEWQQRGEPKSKLVVIKPGTRFQSKVRGYLYRFDLTAPEALHQLIHSSGVGEKSSMGFGWVEGSIRNPQGFKNLEGLRVKEETKMK